MSETAQEQFWRGDFGASYTTRNRVDWEKRIPFWRHILGLTQANSIIEVGTNAGWNLRAIGSIDPEIFTFGVDINETALKEADDAGCHVARRSATEVGQLWPGEFDLAFTAGVLIHVPPAQLHAAMRSIAEASNRWVLAVEYAADVDTEIEYRGHAERLWKRPFGKLYEDMGLTLRHTLEAGGGFGFDDCTAWLLEKR